MSRVDRIQTDSPVGSRSSISQMFLDIGQALPKPLSTIRSKRLLIGKVAVETLLADAKRPAEPRIINTGFDIIEGATA